MLILRPGELQIRPNGDIFARTDSPERVFDKSRVRFYVILICSALFVMVNMLP